MKVLNFFFVMILLLALTSLGQGILKKAKNSLKTHSEKGIYFGINPFVIQWTRKCWKDEDKESCKRLHDFGLDYLPKEYKYRLEESYWGH